ncbi:SDR family oxidoreductase [Curtobacterium sp. RRHDQ66]
MDITNATVFIPGATSGIGLGLALRLQEAGSTVVIGGRRRALLDALAAEHGFGTVELDVTDPESITAAAATVSASIRRRTSCAPSSNAFSWSSSSNRSL